MTEDLLLKKLKECERQEELLRVRRQVLEELLTELDQVKEEDNTAEPEATEVISGSAEIEGDQERSMSDLRSFLSRYVDEDAQ